MRIRILSSPPLLSFSFYLGFLYSATATMGQRPILSLLGNVVISAIVVGCTYPHSHALRTGGFLLTALCTWHCITIAKDSLVRNP
jgi:hypothetical protein